MTGLPFAGPTTERDELGDRIWKTRAQWSADDYALNIKSVRSKKPEAAIRREQLAIECRSRFGHLPSLLTVVK